jgi:hypothetical protein
MSERYPGGFITKAPVTPAGPYQDGAAPGVWTLDQQMQYQKQGVWPTAGSAANYIEDVFSTYLYTGNGSAQTITNGIDLSTKGGLVWLKDRTSAYSNILTDTARGATKVISSNSTYAQSTYPTMLTAFNSNGFSLGSSTTTNQSGDNYASWSFREQPKFFDIVTYTGTGSNTTIAHNLGSTPGCIIVKRTDTTSDWQVYHSGLTSAAYSIQLNLTNGQASAPTVWNSTAPTNSVFSVGTSTAVNASGGTYVAYLFASNAGGFGAAGTDNVITCGMVPAGSTSVTLGWEPQCVLIKSVGTAYDWEIYDTFRGLTTIGGISKQLAPNSISAEASMAGGCNITATGMQIQDLTPSTDRIYIAIRRGPMKTPTDATKVFGPITSANVTGTKQTTGFPVDMQFSKRRNVFDYTYAVDRLRGVSTTTSGASSILIPPTTDPEASYSGLALYWDNTGFQTPSSYSSSSTVFWNFQRAPGFFDEVCYSGTGVNQTIAHNLGITPELVIVKSRVGDGITWPLTGWMVYAAPLGIVGSGNLQFNLQSAGGGGTVGVFWNSFSSSNFSVGYSSEVNGGSGNIYVAYLFATCPGVSKVGSYTGTGATQTINCGFTGGARFVLIKRTDSTGDWYIWDTARGMVSGTDPSLLLNSALAEVNANSVYTATTGFQIVSTAAGINASGGTYIFLAIA